MIKHYRWKILLQLIIVSIIAGCGYVTEEEYLPRYFNDSENPYIIDIYPPEGSTLNSLEYIDVTYSEPVLGADVLDNYTLNGSGLGSLSIRDITNLSDNKYRISLSGSPSDGEVTLTINNITDLNENLLSEEVFTYQMDLTGPTVVATPTSGSKVDSLTQIDLQYSETVIGADVLNNYSLSGSGIGTLALSSVTEIGVNKYRLTLTGAPGDSQIVLTISNVYDGVGNALSGNTINYTGWWDTDWRYRRKLVFDNSGQTENLVDFPVLVKLNSSRIDYSSTQDNGEDIRFVDPDGTVLSYEIESWDESGASIVWVKVPQIDGGSTTDYIWMYYGNSSATDGQNVADVWSNGYELVMHLDETTGNFEDSTGNGHYGQAFDGVTRGVNGKIGKAVSFDGSSGYIALYMKYTEPNVIPELTVNVWFNTSFVYSETVGTLDNTNWSFVDFDRSDFYNFYITGKSGVLEFSSTASSTDDFPASTTGLNDGTWHLGWAVYDGNDKIIYLNGTQDAIRTNAHSGAAIGISSTRWGFIGDGSEATEFDGSRNNIYYDGYIDEVRISNVARSADWIAAQYLSMNDSFITFGAEE